MDYNDPSIASGTGKYFLPPSPDDEMDDVDESLVPSFGKRLHIQTSQQLPFLAAARQPPPFILSPQSLESVKALYRHL